MNKKWLVLCLLSMLYIQGIYGQGVVGGVASKGSEMNARPHGIVEEMDSYLPKVKGTVYLDDNWLPGELKLINGHEVKGYTMKFDLSSDVMEIKVNNEIKALGGNKIREFRLENPLLGESDSYINSRLVKSKGEVPLVGFFKVLESGNINLYSHFRLEEIKANYNKALDLGDRDSKLVKKITYYLYIENQLQPIPKSKRKFSELFSDKEKEVMTFVNSNHLNIKKEGDLISIIKHMNE